MSSTQAFWLGIILSSFIGVAVNLVTPNIRNFISKYNGSIRKKIEDGKVREQLFAEWPSRNPVVLIMHLVRQQGLILLGLLGVVFTWVWASTIIDRPQEVVVLPIATVAMLILVMRTDQRIRKINRIWKGVLKHTGWFGWGYKYWSSDTNSWTSIDHHPTIIRHQNQA